MRQHINIINEAAAVMAADAPEEVSQITEQFADTIFDLMTRAKYQVERRFDEGGFTIEGFNPYPDFKGFHSVMVWKFSTEGGVVLLSRLITHTSNREGDNSKREGGIDYLTVDALQTLSLEKFKMIMAKSLKLAKKALFVLGITNRVHAFGANVLKAHGVPIMRARK